MSLFDLAAGLVLIVSALVGWIRGATREVAGVVALVLAAVAGFLALRITGPIARHAIHTVWLANLAVILIVFGAVYVILRVVASALTRRLHRTSGLGGADRTIGAGVGVARALVLLGLANLVITAATPPERMPVWIAGAYLYPLSAASADTLKSFAPRGVALAHQLAPAMGHAIASNDASAQDQDDNAPAANAPGLRVERSP